jgi:hypothetical protein
MSWKRCRERAPTSGADVAVAASKIDLDEAAIVDVLRRGGSYTGAEIACQTDLPIRSVNDYLRRLRARNQVAQASQYQYRFFRLTTPMTSGDAQMQERTAAEVPGDIRFARSCYGHLAGWLGVTVTRAVLDRCFLAPIDDEFELTRDGQDWLRGLGILLPEKRVPRRRFARPCLDWTEKRPHLAGVVGEALLNHSVARGWLERWPAERTLTLTPPGETALAAAFGIAFR